VPVEAAIFDRDERGRRQRIEPGDVYGRFLDRTAKRDRMPVGAFQEQRGIGERLQRSGERRGNDQPNDRYKQQCRDRVEYQRPTAAGAARNLLLLSLA
jgi:hypothetical protein